MKIIITGHCSGIGKAFYDFLSPDHEIIGFDIKEGNDISSLDTFETIL
jgi:nucleoside-diphosphate-sugar epimerase